TADTAGPRRRRSCRRYSRAISRSAPCRTCPRRSPGSVRASSEPKAGEYDRGAHVRGIDRRSIQNFDWTLLALVALLSAAGLVDLYSATWTPDGLSDEMRRQLISFGIGAAAAAVCTAVDYRHFE